MRLSKNENRLIYSIVALMTLAVLLLSPSSQAFAREAPFEEVAVFDPRTESVFEYVERFRFREYGINVCLKDPIQAFPESSSWNRCSSEGRISKFFEVLQLTQSETS